MLIQAAPYFGYLASLFLIIALLVKTDIKFRVYNIFGTICFMAYGIIFHAWPVLITNVILFCINIYYLRLLYRHEENFDLLKFTGDEKLAEKFLSFYKTDIAGYFPDFAPAQLHGDLNFVVLRDLVIANMFSARISPGGDAAVMLNFTIKKYRDYKVGKFIFEKEKQFLLSKGVKRIVYDSVFNKDHAKFLLASGFVKTGERYVKNL